MDYEITISGKSMRVAISRGSGLQEDYDLKAQGDRMPKKIAVVRREPSRLVLSIEDRMYSVIQLRRTSGSVEFILNGDLVVAELAQKKVAEEVRSDIASVDELVTSNFPAKVVKIFASRGSKIKEGETLMVVEAMKMEAQIKSPRNCAVLEIFVKEGDMVFRGAKVARLKFI